MQVVGMLGLFFIPIPLFMKQAYLVWVGVMVAYIFTFIPEWTAWILLVAMALYDLAAVLCPGGPLKVSSTLRSLLQLTGRARRAAWRLTAFGLPLTVAVGCLGGLLQAGTAASPCLLQAHTVQVVKMPRSTSAGHCTATLSALPPCSIQCAALANLLPDLAPCTARRSW